MENFINSLFLEFWIICILHSELYAGVLLDSQIFLKFSGSPEDESSVLSVPLCSVLCVQCS
jgi:hypothetical protein